ncbi:MAG: hypothetical protein AAF907_08290, partial [Planctomycetota bacterium]
RANLTWDLHREFNSSEMLGVRDRAERIVKVNPSKNIEELRQALTGSDDRGALSILSAFYQRLYLAIEHKRVDSKLVPALFGEMFTWWYLVSFKTQLSPLGWDKSIAVDNLYKWMCGRRFHVFPRVRREELQRWKEAAVLEQDDGLTNGHSGDASAAGSGGQAEPAAVAPADPVSA